jgi:YVTN family beta-propeller protein
VGDTALDSVVGLGDGVCRSVAFCKWFVNSFPLSIVNTPRHSGSEPKFSAVGRASMTMRAMPIRRTAAVLMGMLLVACGVGPNASSTPAATASPTPAAHPAATGPPTSTPAPTLVPTGVALVRVTADTLEVRASADPQAAILGSVLKGELLSVVGTPKPLGGQTWWHLSVGSLDGWATEGPPADPHLIDGKGRASLAFNVWQATTGEVAAALRKLPPRVFVPNEASSTVTVIDPATFTVLATYGVGSLPQHITPAHDMSALYVDNMNSSLLSVIDPASSTITGGIQVPSPYNLYFSLDGKKALVMAEPLNRIDFYDAATWSLLGSVAIPSPGIDHADFSAGGRYLLASCEFGGWVVKVDVVSMQLVSSLEVGGKPIDVKLSPDGMVFYVANQGRAGVSIIDPVGMSEVGFLPTGQGAHGMAISRDTRSLYVSNRLDGTISVIDFASRKVVATWRIGGSPDMLQVSPNGKQLWISNRSGATISVVDTTTGGVIAEIGVGNGPHGLAYFPQPGRISLGHNGVYR